MSVVSLRTTSGAAAGAGEGSRRTRRSRARPPVVPSVSRYTIAASGALHLTGTAPFAGSRTAGYGPEDAALTPNGRMLWVVDTKGDALSAFDTATGHISAAAASQTTLPEGAVPFGIVVN